MSNARGEGGLELLDLTHIQVALMSHYIFGKYFVYKTSMVYHHNFITTNLIFDFKNLISRILTSKIIFLFLK